MVDVLAQLSEAAVAAWYRRLADWVSNNLARQLGVEPLSARLLRHYLDGKGKRFEFAPPQHLTTSTFVKKELLYHREVYLTKKKARLGEAKMVATIKVWQREDWAGIVPRLNGTGGRFRWDGQSPLTMDYTSNCEVPVQQTQVHGTPGDQDLLYALHGFDLRTDVTVTGMRQPGKPQLTIRFTKFTARVHDHYDWSRLHTIKVPNPDYQSKAADAVTPQSDFVQVHHTNAIRLHDKGLAHPFEVDSLSWGVADAAVTKDAVVDPSKGA